MRKIMSQTVVSLGLLGWLALSVAAKDQAPVGGAEANFQRGFFLQVHQHDLPGAAAAYENVVSDSAAPDALRSQAKTRLVQIREDLASANFARLMPANVLGYAELVQPGDHIARILNMMGLLGPSEARVDSAAQKPIVLGNGLYLPADFTVSPALVAELKKFRGAAVGVTSLDDQGRPAGLAAIHPGDCDLLRGAIETAVQLLEPGEPIASFKTYRIPDVGWVMLTARLVFVSDSRDQLAAAVERLGNPQAESLASSDGFKRAAAESPNALFFAYVDGPQIVKRFGSQLRGPEAEMIRGLLDLDHFESLVVALTTTEDGIRLRAEMNLMPGHHNMLYALIRTAPVTKRSLSLVPQGAAGVLVVGLNPAGPAAPADAANPQGLSAMDLGREFFNNVEELAVFVLPPAAVSDGDKSLPEIGAVLAVKDPAKSEALWNQLLSLAALFGARTTKAPSAIDVAGKPGRVYAFSGAPPIAVVRADRELVIGTQGAVTAAIQTLASKNSIADDKTSLLARLTPDTSKALFLDVGRCVDIAASLSKGREAQQLKSIGAVTHNLKVSVATDEAPNRLTIRAEVTGLPQFCDIVSLVNAQKEQRATAKK
jgi:hypothetical protein